MAFYTRYLLGGLLAAFQGWWYASLAGVRKASATIIMVLIAEPG